MRYSACNFQTDALMRDEAYSASLGGDIQRLCEHVKTNQIYHEKLWERFVSLFTFPSDVGDRGWRCEYWGKMMRGASSVYEYTKDEALYRILKKTISDLLAAADEDGRISTYDRKREFDGWDMWGRKYILLGLQYFCEVCPEEDFVARCEREMCRQLDYIIARIGKDKKPITSTARHWLGANSCSILEPVVRLYNVTKQPEYLAFADYIVDVCYGGENQLNIFATAHENKLLPHEYVENKAYETMSCFEGLIEYYRVTGEEKHRRACINFAERVMENEISIIGCAGCTHELFDNTRLHQVDPAFCGIMQETCVSVTWMKLCSQLLRLTGEPKYADAIERTFFNAYLGAANFNNRPLRQSMKDHISQGQIQVSGILPFDSYSPLRVGVRGKQIGGFRVSPNGTFYGCCACIAAMGIGTYTRMAALRSAQGVVLNSYVAGWVTLGEVTLHIASGYPYDGRVHITVEGEGEFTLSLRIPEWSENTQLSVCGQKASANIGYTHIRRVWCRGDEIDLQLDDSVRTILPPKESPYCNDYIALRKGAIILALDKRVADPEQEVSFEAGTLSAVPVACDSLPYYALSLEIMQADKTPLHFIDYASAGSTFDEQSLCAAWLKRR